MKRFSLNAQISYFDGLQDNVIFERLTETSQYKELTVAHLEQFATEGKKGKKDRGRDEEEKPKLSFSLVKRYLISLI